MKKKKPIRRTKYTYVQHWGTFQNETLVSVGTTFDDLKRYLARKKIAPEQLESFEGRRVHVEDIMKDARGLFFDIGEGCGSVLWLKRWPDNWEYNEVLVHELHHATFIVLGKGRGMADEMEALAYAQEHLFRQIRRRLSRMFFPEKWR